VQVVGLKIGRSIRSEERVAASSVRVTRFIRNRADELGRMIRDETRQRSATSGLPATHTAALRLSRARDSLDVVRDSTQELVALERSRRPNRLEAVLEPHVCVDATFSVVKVQERATAKVKVGRVAPDVLESIDRAQRFDELAVGHALLVRHRLQRFDARRERRPWLGVSDAFVPFPMSSHAAISVYQS
jgi:hypothetical protein